MDSFFEETAEELVNRLCKTWLEEKTFLYNLPITDPVLKKMLITKLEEYDELLKQINSLYSSEVKQSREYYVLKEVATGLSVLANFYLSKLSPKPTHRQTCKKPNHLRLVANG